MSEKHKIINVSTSKKVQLVDVTGEVEKIVQGSGVNNGVCYVFTPHTTAAITINENADPDVQRDFVLGINEMVPENLGYSHSEGNSPAHIKSSLVGCSMAVFIENGALVLGQWQGLYFCEFDGPRSRQVFVKVLKQN